MKIENRATIKEGITLKIIKEGLDNVNENFYSWVKNRLRMTQEQEVQ